MYVSACVHYVRKRESCVRVDTYGCVCVGGCVCSCIMRVYVFGVGRAFVCVCVTCACCMRDFACAIRGRMCV